jgi:hypothetical protein
MKDVYHPAIRVTPQKIPGCFGIRETEIILAAYKAGRWFSPYTEPLS